MNPTKLQLKIQQRQERKMIIPMYWSVHPLRKDKRTGVISPIQTSPYLQYAYDEIERQFRK